MTKVFTPRCPMCGWVHPKQFWDNISDESISLMLAQDFRGRGNIVTLADSLNPSDNYDAFYAVKRRFLSTVTHWLERGWLILEELK